MTSWLKELRNLENFTFQKSELFFQSKGVREDNLGRGRAFFCEGYIHEIWANYDDDSYTTMKAKCYRSQKKNKAPHVLSVLFSNSTGLLKEGHCSCEVGSSESCHHLIALCLTLEYYKTKKMKRIPESLTCTDLPQQWNRPRGSKILPERVMTAVFSKPNLKKKSRKPVSSILFTPMVNNSTGPSSEDVHHVKNELTKINSLIPWSYLLVNKSSKEEFVPAVNLYATKNSVLSYQLRDINVTNEVATIEDNELTKKFPIENHHSRNIFHSVPPVEFPPHLRVTLEEAYSIEENTQNQSNSASWFSEREKRFTASSFGEIFHRKKKPNQKFLERIMKSRDLSHVSAVRHGRVYESVALKKYQDARPSIKVTKAGLVVQPEAPHLGASPDGHLVDPAMPHDEANGVLEIKCPRWLSVADGLKKNPCHLDDNAKLKKSSHYYAQVQGQMLICGVEWGDFVTYIETTDEIIIERIFIDSCFVIEMYTKLHCTYLNYVLHFQSEIDVNNDVNEDNIIIIIEN